MANKPTPEKSGRFTKAAKSHPHGTKVTPRVLDKATEIVANTGIDKKAPSEWPWDRPLSLTC